MSKPALLVLTSTFPRWEGDHEPPFVYELARRLTDRFDVTVLAPHAPGAHHREIMAGVRVVRFRYAPDWLEKLAYNGGIPVRLRRNPWLNLLVPLFLAAQLIACRRLIRQLRPAAVHAHWLLPQGLIGLLGSRLSGLRPRLLVTAHGADLHGLNSRLARQLKCYVLDRADAVSVPSTYLARLVADDFDDADKLHVAPMGVDLRETFVPAGQSPAHPTLVFAGRLVEKKGVARLLEAMPAVLARAPDCRLLVAGHGPLLSTLQAQARALGISSHIDFLGPYLNDDLPDILRRGTIGVFPFQIAGGGDQEGLGLVVIEAMGCGLPVVVGNVPAVRDVVVDGSTGKLVPPADSAQIAEAIIGIVSSPKLARCLGDRGRGHALARFDWTVVAERYRELLSSDTRHGGE